MKRSLWDERNWLRSKRGGADRETEMAEFYTAYCSVPLLLILQLPPSLPPSPPPPRHEARQRPRHTLHSAVSHQYIGHKRFLFAGNNNSIFFLLYSSHLDFVFECTVCISNTSTSLISFKEKDDKRRERSEQTTISKRLIELRFWMDRVSQQANLHHKYQTVINRRIAWDAHES